VTQDPGAAPLPPRPPRPPLVHWAIDTAVAFLVMVLPLLFLEISIWIVVVLAVIAGWLLMPFSRRAEQRGLAEREARARGEEPPPPA
jgi:membrane protein implicated in regulation of membrane protease activity